MSLEVKVPVVGESISEVTIARWVKKDGEQVAMDEIICELESDKATFELTAEAAGVLHIKAQEGATVEIGGLLCKIESNGKGAQAANTAPVAVEAAPTKTAQPTGKVIEMKVPVVGESITEVTIGAWSKKEGEHVQLDELLCEIESDKATFELTAEASGILHIKASTGTVLEIGSLICTIDVMDAPASQPSSTPTQASTGSSSAAEKSDSYAAGHPSPAAAKILSEKGISPQELKGSGVGNRITKEDAQQAQKKEIQTSPSTPAPSKSTSTSADTDRSQKREK